MDSGSRHLTPPTPEQVQQFVDSFEESRSAQERIASLSLPILKENAELCDNRTAYSLGFEWITVNDLPSNTREYVGKYLNLGDIPSILYIEAESPADTAGLLSGDLLLSVNDLSIKEDPLQTTRGSYGGEVRPYRKFLTKTLAQANENGSSVRLSYRRGEVDHTVEIQPQERCNVQVKVAEDSREALSSTGGTIYLSRELYEFANSDVELQALVAHQLAHFISGHKTNSETGRGGATIGVVVPLAILGTVLFVLDGDLDVEGGAIEDLVGVLVAGAFAGGRVGSWITTAGNERNADYMSTYLLARAGVDVENAMRIWNRLSTESVVAQEHRASEARLKAIDKAIQEVYAKRAANEPLLPDPTRRESEPRVRD